MNPNARAITTLCFAELVERLSYFGLFAVIILKLDVVFHLHDARSFAIFGLFTAFSYTLLVLGGYIADKWFGARWSIVLGGILLIVANLCLATNTPDLFYMGLSLLTVGTALFKVNCTSLVGVLCVQEKSAREQAYTWLYTCMNIGGTLGPIVYGLIIALLGWSECFWLSAVLIAVALGFFCRNDAIKACEGPGKKSLLPYGVLILLVVCVCLGFLFHTLSTATMVLMFVVAVVVLLYSGMRTKAGHKKSFAALLLLYLACVAFFACSLQVGSSITLFIHRAVSLSILSFHIPTPWFTALDPLFVVLMAPVFIALWRALAKRGREPFVSTKVAIGIALAAIAFLILYLASRASAHSTMYTSIFWLVMANLFLGAGEICLSPAVLSCLHDYVPRSLYSTMTGAWFLFIALGGYFAGELSKLTTVFSYGQAFLLVAAFAAVSAVLVLLMKPLVVSLGSR
ncbi:MAG: hypothetical protein COV52_08775 [Gammaproteobacteria bacterium CG11_big_fil_rev_8_21_14_0_20_46_22]|nr:MAG: hypothetical protein COW05_09925 [Gammaproteobacteria bacterium CG12_big_fil_rev_8_21_14_0_65_46_12]PIR10373.1 MAG: hypothetical protein COV52_08775 [Gammaproteobacteria bacterium CG11_big_fil_rev_8_21_14_0_20_46_22]